MAKETRQRVLLWFPTGVLFSERMGSTVPDIDV